MWFLLIFLEKFQENLSLSSRNNVSFTSESSFVFIGLFLLCSVVDKWLKMYRYNRRQEFNMEIQVKMLPYVIVFRVCRAYYCLYMEILIEIGCFLAALV